MAHTAIQNVKLRGSLAGVLLIAALFCAPITWAENPDMDARQVTQLLFQADPALPPDLSGLNLQNLDLAALDFKRAKLAKADLFGSDLTGANLSGVDLSAARLDRVTLIKSNFDGAVLTGATLLRPTSFSSLSEQLSEASSFVGVQMRDAKAFGQFNGFNFKEIGRAHV